MMRNAICHRHSVRVLQFAPNDCALTTTRHLTSRCASSATVAPIVKRHRHRQLLSSSIPRPFHSSPTLSAQSKAPNDPGPTDFNSLNVLGETPAPATSVDVCMHDGFGLNSGVTIAGGDGALLVSGEAFSWRPWAAIGEMRLVNKKGQLELPAEAFGVFDLLWPRPDLLIVGVGKHNMPLSPQTRRHISELGMRAEVLDTRNAAAQFNLLATERGVTDVAAALIPIGWEEGKGAK